MIKKIFCGIAVIAGLTACNDDYTDWADTQSNAANAAAEKFVLDVQSQVEGKTIDFATETATDVLLFTTNLEAGQTDEYNVTLTAAAESNDKVATLTTADGTVAIADLEAAVTEVYGRAPKVRVLNVEVSAEVRISTEDGTITAKKSGTPFVLNAKPDAPVISSAYYLVGDMLGWDKDSMVQFSHSGADVYDDPVFTVAFTTTADNQYWKIIPQSNVDAGDIWLEPGVVGPANNGDTAMEGQLVNTAGVGAGMIETAGKYIMTINMMDYTYKIEPAPLELYMTGSNYNNWSDWQQLTPVNGFDGEFWKIIYLHADEQFKFAPQADWGNDFGGEATINDEAGAGITVDGTNLKVTNAGWYLLHVVNGSSRTVNVYAPDVYLIGDVAPVNDWTVNDANKFTVPATDNGEFVSPAFAADGQVRICVNFGGFDWWRTEFIVFGNQITYRGNGGDQDRVSVTTGQRAYLNFSAGTGEFK